MTKKPKILKKTIETLQEDVASHVNEEVSPTCLSGAQYWEWRTTISEMQKAQQALEIGNKQWEIMQKDAQMANLRAELFRATSVSKLTKEKDASVKEYDRFKKFLEDEIGVSLNNKLIDDLTFEVKEFDDEINSAQ